MATMEELQEKLEKLTAELKSREVYFPPKEKKIRPFNGSDGTAVRDFVEDIQAGLKLRRLKKEDAIHYVNAHLEGAARQEVKHRPAGEKTDAQSILKILEDAFGDRLTLGQLMRQAYHRIQEDGESVTEYGYALLSLGARIEEKAGAAEAEKIIKEQFQDGLSDQILRREVKRLVKEKPQLSFLEVRDWAVDMEDGERSHITHRRRGAVRQAEVAVEMGPMVEGLTAAIRGQTDVLEKMRTQQEEFNFRLTKLEERNQNSMGRRPQVDIRNVQCYRCQQFGHYARTCRVPLANGIAQHAPRHHLPTVPPQLQSQSQTTPGGLQQSSQSEN